jgi:hypothetical protein
MIKTFAFGIVLCTFFGSSNCAIRQVIIQIIADFLVSNRKTVFPNSGFFGFKIEL